MFNLSVVLRESIPQSESDNVRTCGRCSSTALPITGLEGCGSFRSSKDVSSVGTVCCHAERVAMLTVVPTAAFQHVEKSSLELLCNAQNSATAT